MLVFIDTFERRHDSKAAATVLAAADACVAVDAVLVARDDTSRADLTLFRFLAVQ